jgi:alpha-2-macroglobulin
VTNAWGVLAVEKFSAAFEKTPVAGASAAALAGTERRFSWAHTPEGKVLDFPWPDKREDLALHHEGAGRPWILVQTRAAIPLTAPRSTGFGVTKTVSAVESAKPGVWSRGDILRVRLAVSAQSDMAWVVVSDPIPAGASHLGTGLQRESRIAVSEGNLDQDLWPSFVERSFEALRAYYEIVPKGDFAIEYTIRLNQAGRFELPPTRVEALYAPEMFGEIPNAPMDVLP